jgi:hypothetical protein
MKLLGYKDKFLLEGRSIVTRQTTADSEIRRLREDREKLVTALQTLFALLEDYAPGWYTQKHHDIASDALASAKGSTSPSSVRHR